VLEELVLLDPAPAMSAPQITCVISPFGDLNSLHAVLEFNHQTYPAYVPGGLQLQVWNGRTPIVQKQLSESKVLATAQETITWRTAMEVRGATLMFQIVMGTSTTWGNFGGTDQLTAIVNPSTTTPIMNLNNYTPALSVAKSCVGFASNRVKSLVLKKVCVFASNGDMFEDTTRRPVFENSSASSQ
jgi:hypothetical protein